jgi:hypothetical protein
MTECRKCAWPTSTFENAGSLFGYFYDDPNIIEIFSSFVAMGGLEVHSSLKMHFFILLWKF